MPSTNQTTTTVAVPPQITQSVYRFAALEGIRGILACWVVVGHILWGVGFLPENVPPIVRLAMAGEFAVDVFVILSGFVVTHLLLSKDEPYKIYIVRRFLRLWPMHMVILILTIVYLFWVMPLLDLPTTGLENFTIAAGLDEHWPELIAANIAMLHGLIPEAWIDAGSLAINAPAWSISLEWQFYLLAPWLIIAIKKISIKWLAMAIVLIVLLRPDPPWVSLGAFLPAHIEFFALGMFCRYFWLNITQTLWLLGAKAIGLLMLLGIICSNEIGMLVAWQINDYEPTGLIPLLLWLGIMALLVFNQEPEEDAVATDIAAASNHWDAKLYKSAKANQIFLTLGKWLSAKCLYTVGLYSYSIYICHYLLLRISLAALNDTMLAWSPAERFMLITAVMIVLLGIAAPCGYYLVERPGIKWGRRIAKRMYPSATAAGDASGGHDKASYKVRSK